MSQKNVKAETNSPGKVTPVPVQTVNQEMIRQNVISKKETLQKPKEETADTVCIDIKLIFM